jgi:hypothetical protein
MNIRHNHHRSRQHPVFLLLFFTVVLVALQLLHDDKDCRDIIELLILFT